MKICVINSDFKLGGQQKIALKISELLSENNHEVSLYSFYPYKPFYDVTGKNMTIDYSNDDLTFLSKLKRKIERKLFYNKGNAKPSREFKKRLKKLTTYLFREQIDVVILSGGFLTSFAAEIKKEIPGIKVIVWQHNTAEIYLNNYFTEIKNDYISGLANSDAIVCLTKHDKTVFQEYNNNTFAISNVLTIDSIDIESKFVPNRLLFVSRYDIKQKGIDLVFDVMRLLPDEFTLSFAGTGNEKQVEEVKKLIEEKDLNARVNLLGALNVKELSKLYSGGSIFLSTSRWEGFGLVMVEAMEFGVPVIAFDTEGAKEIIDNNKYGILVESNDIETMAKSIIDLHNDKNQYRRISELSKERAKDFSASNIGLLWEEVLNKI